MEEHCSAGSECRKCSNSAMSLGSNGAAFACACVCREDCLAMALACLEGRGDAR